VHQLIHKAIPFNVPLGNITPAKTFNLSASDGLSPGYYQAAAYDHAGNSSQKFNFKFPELSAININSANALYNNFKGISGTAPSTLERSHTFEFSESVAGVSAVSIDGPQGNLWAQTFDPPVYRTATVLADLPVGNYTAKSFNSVGAETMTPFIRNFIFLSVGNHTIALIQHLTANPVNVRTAEIIARPYNAVLLAKRYTASYARGVALCQPLTRLASAPKNRNPGLPALVRNRIKQLRSSLSIKKHRST